MNGQRRLILKGKKLEEVFDRWIEHWNKVFGVLAIRIEVRTGVRNGETIYKKKQPADYIIVTSSHIWLVDSKECSQDVFYPKRQPRHQVTEMKRIRQVNKNAKSGFIVWFKKQDPAMINLRFISDLDSPASVDSGEKFSWEKI